MNKNKIILPVMLLVVIVYINGCLMGKTNYTSVKYYGLRSSHQQLPADTTIKIANISAIGGTGTKMAFKTRQCRVMIDEYHRWLNRPATMIKIALQSSFSGSAATITADVTEYTVTATVFEFMADVENNTAVLGVNYQIKSKRGDELEELVTFKVPLKSVDPDNYALAMSKAVNQLAAHLSKAIKSLAVNR